jgi:hypothetical protein
MFCTWYIIYYICNYSIQSARLSIQSSELGPPTSSPALIPPCGKRGETHSLEGERVGGPNSEDGTDPLVLNFYPLVLYRYTIISLRVQYTILYTILLFKFLYTPRFMAHAPVLFNSVFWTGGLKFFNRMAILLYQKISAIIKKTGVNRQIHLILRKF